MNMNIIAYQIEGNTFRLIIKLENSDTLRPLIIEDIVGGLKTICYLSEGIAVNNSDKNFPYIWKGININN